MNSVACCSSIGVNDFEIPEAKAKIIAHADAEVKEIEEQYASGLVTQGEKYNKGVTCLPACVCVCVL